jgi:predicted acylesterase/phospholipase RssA
MYNKLVLAGGSIKGGMYIGVLNYFEENDIILEYLNEIVGTSIGALLGLLIVLGYSSQELKNLFLSMNFEDLKDLSLENLEEGFGFDNGDKIERFVKMLITNKGYKEDITFIELYNKTKIVYACCTYNISKKITTFFDHIDNPNMPIYIATRTSMNIPILFCAVKYLDDYYVDGGTSCNLPIKYITNKYKGDNEIMKKTLSIVFEETNYHSKTSIKNFEEFLYNLMKSTFNEMESKDKNYVKENGYDLLILKTKLTTSSSFHISNEEKIELFDTAYEQTKLFFDSKKLP